MKTLHCSCFWSALFISDHRWIVQPLATSASDRWWVNTNSRRTMWITNFHLQNMFTPLCAWAWMLPSFLSPGLYFPLKSPGEPYKLQHFPAYVHAHTHRKADGFGAEPPTSPPGHGLASYKTKLIPRKKVWAAWHSCFMLPTAPRLRHQRNKGFWCFGFILKKKTNPKLWNTEVWATPAS